METPNLLQTLGTGMTNLGGNILDMLTFVDKKAISTFKNVKDKLLSHRNSSEEEDNEPITPLETEAADLLTTLEDNHKFLFDATKISEIPFDVKEQVRKRALATIETVGVLKRLLGADTAKTLIDRGPITFDDIEAVSLEALLKTKP